jgi:hypothetical protein
MLITEVNNLISTLRETQKEISRVTDLYKQFDGPEAVWARADLGSAQHRVKDAEYMVERLVQTANRLQPVEVPDPLKVLPRVNP